MNESINDEAVYWTAPATPGPLNIRYTLIIRAQKMRFIKNQMWCVMHYVMDMILMEKMLMPLFYFDSCMNLMEYNAAAVVLYRHLD